jgi:hypothetical protein
MRSPYTPVLIRGMEPALRESPLYERLVLVWLQGADYGEAVPRTLLKSAYSVVSPNMQPSTNGTAQSCHQGAPGNTAQGRGQAILMNSNTDQ